MKEQVDILVKDILSLVDDKFGVDFDEDDVEQLQDIVYRCMERNQRIALTLAVTACEAHAVEQSSHEARVALQQLAIRLAKLALLHPQLAPLRGPRKATR